MTTCPTCGQPVMQDAGRVHTANKTLPACSPCRLSGKETRAAFIVDRTPLCHDHWKLLQAAKLRRISG